MNRDQFHSLRVARPNMRDLPGVDEAMEAAVRIVRQYRSAVTVGITCCPHGRPCIPSTVLPAQYIGKRVRLVIED